MLERAWLPGQGRGHHRSVMAGRRWCRAPRAAAIAAFLLPPIPLSAIAQTGMEAGLARCADVQDGEARLACFDALAARGRAPALEPAPMPPGPVPPSPEITAATPPARAIAPELAPDAPEARPGTRREFLGLRPYRRNYLLPVAFNARPNRSVPAGQRIDDSFAGDALDDVEMKFQLSFEIPFWTGILEQDLDLYFAYTQIAFFQAYNREYSSPFRETNYEPELGLNWEPSLSALGWQLTSARLALNHQSNGRSEPLSRSWNRLIGQVQVERGDLSLALRLWTLLDNAPPDNPDIADYLGYGELHAGYDLGRHHFGVMVRNPRQAAVQVDWSYPLGKTLSLYVQYFNGYGESLLDYDHTVNRIGLGFQLNDWP